MSGDKQHIHLKAGAVPQAYHTPIPVPHHWKKAEKAQLDQDEQL